MVEKKSDILSCIYGLGPIASARVPLIFFYYHHFGGLGHGMRIYSICKALKDAYPPCRLFVINSGKPQPELHIDKYASVINLPFFKAKCGLFSGLSSKEGSDSTFKKRKRILEELIRRFTPDAAIFEHYPFGRNALKKEIEYFISLLKIKKIPAYSCVRDIITQRITPDELLRRSALFDAIFVHSDKEMGFITAFHQPRALKEKIIFTGRVFPDQPQEFLRRSRIRDILGCKDKKLVVVSAGGGMDGFPIIKDIIAAKKEADKKVKSLFLISAGSSIPKNELGQLKKIARLDKGVILTQFINNFTDYVYAADLSISMGGYNSVNNALFTGTPTIVIPRRLEEEQSRRARYFSEFLRPCVSHSAKGIGKAIAQALTTKMPLHMSYSHPFSGAQVTARAILAILRLEYLKFRLTTRCNLKCDMCSWKGRSQELDFEVLKRSLHQAALLRIKNVSFTGGEATLYPHFNELLRYAKKRGFLVTVCTNGFLDKERLKMLCKFADTAVLPMDSHHSDIFDKERGVKGAFQRVLYSQKVLHARGVRIHVNVTVRPDTYKGIHRIVALLKDYAYSMYFHIVDTSENKLQYLSFKVEEALDYYLHEVPLILKSCLRYRIKCKIQPLLEDISADATRQALDIIADRCRYRRRLKQLLTPDVSWNCTRPARSLRINSDGEVSPCCTLDNTMDIIGNIYHQDLIDILSSDKYFDFLNNARPQNGPCRQCGKEYRKFAQYF